MLSPKLIHFENKELTKEQILKQMIDRICTENNLKDCSKKLMENLLQRESESATVYPTGIAIPHIRIEGLDDTIVAIHIPHKPLIDNGQEVKIYILILTDKNISSLYLNVVAAFMRVSKDTGLFNALLSAKDVHTFVNLIKDADIKIKDEVTISDIMTPNPIVINETDTIKHMVEVLSENKLSFLPVVNSKNELVGEVDILQYLKVSLPDFMLMMNNLNFLRNYEPFERLYKQEEIVKVKDVMDKPKKTLHPEYAIIEAVFEMIKLNKRSFTVVKDNKVIGVVSATDIYRRVVRA
jgi:CBS domain-containing protein/mannitol/fructose-specific phosphotransferase system IIA component